MGHVREDVAVLLHVSLFAALCATWAPEESLAKPRAEEAPRAWKLMTAHSVFSCLSGPFEGRRHGAGSADMANCTDGKQQLWHFPIDLTDEAFRIPFAGDLSFCLGVQGLGALGTYPCSSGDDVTFWEYRSFYLVHRGSGGCLRWDGMNGRAPGWAVMGDCPTFEAQIRGSYPDYGHAADGSEVFTRANVTLERFVWIPVATARLVPLEELPLRVVGPDLVGASGHVVKLRGVNWYGSHMEQMVNNGMNEITIAEMAQLLKNLGFNMVRILYGTQMLFEDPKPNQDVLRANPNLLGKSSMEILDYQIEMLTRAGLLVVVNNHVTVSRWCCKLDDGNALWFNEDWTETQWLLGLRKVAARYRDNPLVVGVDLRNEPREDMGRPGKSNDPHYLVWWGHIIEYITQNMLAVDWKAAATEGAKAVWNGNPDALVFVEGTLGGVDLSQVWSQKMNFGQDCLHSRVVYSIHCYVWTEKWLKVIKAWDFQHVTWFRDWRPDWNLLNKVYGDLKAADTSKDYREFALDRDSSWGYLHREALAPIWVGEFGTAGSSNWWLYMVKYLAAMDLDWSYWAVDGIKYPSGYPDENQHVVHPESFGLLTLDYRGLRAAWKLFDLARMLASAGLQKTKVELPGNCTFEPLRNPMEDDSWWRNQRVLSLQQLWTYGQIGIVVCSMCFAVGCLRRILSSAAAMKYHRLEAASSASSHQTDDVSMSEVDGADSPGPLQVSLAPL